MSWWFKDNHNPSFRRQKHNIVPRLQLPWTLLLGRVFVSILILSSLIGADSLHKECGKLQHKCLCGVPLCIEPELVNNGVQDCQDGSDEGQWDPSKCAIKNNTSEDIRFKRAAISELLRETNGGATTTYFEAERGRTRPIGLLTTTLGSFVTTGTTTEYITKLLATYIKGTYARILSTSSRIYHAIPTDGGDFMDNTIKPTGFIASTVSAEIHGYATTAHTTDFYRTYIDGTYAQLVSSYSNVYYPPWYTDPILSTAVFKGSGESPERSEEIYATAPFKMDPGSLRTMKVGKFGTTEYPAVVPTRVVESKVSETRAVPPFPEELTGTFIDNNSTNFNGLAELGLIIGAAAASNGNKLRALHQNNNEENEVRVTGTHGNFIHTDVRSGDETTYNVFTGTYVQNAKTFLFFFGNTVIGASRTTQGQQTILVENGPQKNSLVVDMTDKLKLVVPAHKDRSTIDGSIAGEHMEGVVVEIESSEGVPLLEDDLITVTGATAQTPTPRDPRIDMVTVTLEKNNKAKKTRTFSTSSSSSSNHVSRNNNDRIENENEIPTGRKVGGQNIRERNGAGTIAEAESFLRPTHAARPITIPTYTVGQNDNLQYESTTHSDVEVVYNSEKNIEAHVTSGKQNQATAPVFQRPKSLYPRIPIGNQRGQSSSFRHQKSSFSDANEIDTDLELQNAATTGRATVTYVGFADFTTTVGNTVIVFMPRTKMIEDLSIHSSSTTTRVSPTKIAPTVTRFQNVDPTRYAYTTTTEADEVPESSTPKKPEVPAQPVILPPSPSVRQYTSRGSRKSSSSSEPEVATTKIPDISPSETTILLSGTQTVFTDLDYHDSRILEQQQGVQTILFDSSSFTVEPTPVPPRFIPISPTYSPISPRKSLHRPRQRFSPVEETYSPSTELQSPSVSHSPRSRYSPYIKSSERNEAETPLFPLSSPVFRPQVPQQHATSPVSLITTNGHSSTATTAVYQTDKVNPTGLVTSIAGSIVRDSTTTLFTSLVYGTFIGSSYAQVIKSTSTVYFLIPSKSVELVESPKLPFPSATPVFSVIRPTPAAKFSTLPASSSFSFEVTTTEHSTDPEDEGETTTSFSSFSPTAELEVELPETTTKSGKVSEEPEIPVEEVPTTPGRIQVVEIPTTTGRIQVVEVPSTTGRIQHVESPTTAGRIQAVKIPKTTERIKAVEIPTTTEQIPVVEKVSTPKQIIASRPTTKTNPELLSELENQNEIDRGRKIFGRPRDQVILESTSSSKSNRYSSSSRSRSRASSSKSVDEVIERPTTATEAITELATEDQTIFVTRTVPTTVYRTYTYYTTFFIPKEDETVTSVISREVTSTAVGFVKKTFSNVLSTSSPVSAFDISITDATEATTTLPYIVSVESENKNIKASSASLIYKTHKTTYTYLTTFFTGQTSSVSSREEIVSSIVTLTQAGDSPTKSITPTITPTTPVPSVSPTQTIEPVSSPTHTRELVSSPTQTKKPVSRPTRTKELVSSPTHTKEPVSSPTQAKEPVSRPTRTKELVPTPTQTKEPVSSRIENKEPVSTPHLILRTRTRTFHAPHEGETTVGRGKSPNGKYSIIKRLRSSPLGPTPSLNSEILLVSPTFEINLKSPAIAEIEEPSSSSLIPSVVEHTILRTFFTTYTYFTSLFNGQATSIKTRTEVISNTVPTIVRSTITPILASSSSNSGGRSTEESETTILTTYTYLTTAVNDGIPTESSSVDTFSNVLRGDKTIRSGFVTKTQNAEIHPTAIVGRTASQNAKVNNQIRELEHIADDLNEVGSHLSETSQTIPLHNVADVATVEPQSDYYELESSEMTTERSVYNEHEHFDEESSPKKKMNRGDVSLSVDDDNNELVTATPALKTYETTFTFYTTFYKGGTSTVSSRLETVTNVGTDIVNDAATPETAESKIPAYPITYFTTFTYWTSSFKDKSVVVTSREETVSNVVTPGIDDIAPTTITEAVPQTSKTREDKIGINNNDISPTEIGEVNPEMELTTFLTTFTYYTTSYIGDETIINSRLETITNVIEGTSSATLEVESKPSVSPTSIVKSVQPTSLTKQAAPQEIVVDGSETQEQDYDLPVGLLSSIINTEVVDKTTTLFSTDIYGTYIDGIYAQVLDSTSKIINPTSTSSNTMETKFVIESSETATGLLEVNAGKTVEANQAITTFYTTKTYGTVIDGKFAQLFESTSSVTKISGTILPDDPQKTGLVRIIEGSLIKGDKTTFYTSSVLGTLIDNQYAQVIESTSRFVINPTTTIQTSIKPTDSAIIIVESSEVTTEVGEIPTTTEKESQNEEVVSEELEPEVSKATPELQTSRRFSGRDRSSRLSFSAPTSKSFTPFITPFASRSRSAFAPKRKQSSAVIVTRTDVTPTVTATLAPASVSRNPQASNRGNNFQNRQKSRQQNEGSVSSLSPTPRLPVTTSKSRFQRPRPGNSLSDPTEASNIHPTSTSGSPIQQGGSSPGARGRGIVSRSGSSANAAIPRTKGPVSASRPFTSFVAGGSSSTGNRGGVSSRFALQQRQKSSSTRESPLSPTRASAITTAKPTEFPNHPEEEGEEEEEEEDEQTDEEPEIAAPDPVTKAATSTQPPNRFGSNRFRVNPRIPGASLTTTTTRPRPSTTSRELPFLRRQTFSRPTLATRGRTTTRTTEATKTDSDDESPEDKEEPKESVPSSTQKPSTSLKSLIGTPRPGSSRSPAPPSAPRQRTITTTSAPTPRSTTKRAFAPRVRPPGFPSKGLFRPSASETSTEVNDELEHEESQNLPGRMLKGPMMVSGNMSEQRVTGGRLYIQSGRNLATKVMSNGVEVLVRGDKTGFIGFDRTPVFPSPVTPQAITLPPSTVSRQFHLVEHPNKPNNAIDHLLHSIVRSSTLDMITKTLKTTFTFLTTVLDNQSTIVSSREEIISNVVTQKYRPTIEYTPSVKAETSTIMSPDFMESFGSSYLTSTLTTTYTYFNTFTEDFLPVILTSKDTVSNIITIPAYQYYSMSSPSFDFIYPSQSRVFETETYVTTYSFYKTILDEMNQTHVLTTEETLTQVVVTEALVPAQSKFYSNDVLTPTPPKKTLFTTSTFFTTLLDGTNLVTKSAVEINSNIVQEDNDESQLNSPIFISDFQDYSLNPQTITFSSLEFQKLLNSQEQILESVIILATNTYFTTFTHFTTVIGEGTETNVESRTQIVSQIVTETLSSSDLDKEKLNALKSSYLAEHSTLLEISSSIHEIIPTRTIQGTYYPETQITKHPYWPKDENEGNTDPEYVKSPTAIEEMKDEIHHIVNVLADTSVASNEGASISPDSTHYRPLYATIEYDGDITKEPEFEEVTLRTPNDILNDIGSSAATETEGIVFDTERPINHLPTPPLKSSASSLQETSTHVYNHGLFPDLPTRVRNPIRKTIIKNKYPDQIEHLENDTIYGDMNLGDVSSLVDVYFNNIYVKNKLTAVPVVSGTGVLKKKNTTSTSQFKFEPSTSSSNIQKVDQTQEIFNLLSELTNEEVIPQPDYYDEIKEEDAFTETGDLALKIYNLSILASTAISKKKASPADTKIESIIRTTTEAHNVINLENIDDDYIDTTTSTPIASGDDSIDDFVIPHSEDFSDDDEIEPDKDNDETRPDNNQEETTGTGSDSEASSERVTIVKWGSNGNPEHSEVFVKMTSPKKPGHQVQDKRTSTIMTTKKPRTNKPPIPPVLEYEDTSEVSTKVYNLLIHNNANSAADNSEDLDDNNKSEDEGGKTDEDSLETNIQRRPPGVFSPSGGPSSGGSFGPSKSSLNIASGGPGIGVNTGSHIVTSSTSGINWTPLLNLGALGLGGLGASTLTKLSPLFSSMAGYLKSGFVPGIARNDTQYHKQERPYIRYPSQPHEGTMMNHKEPNYSPINKPKPPMYRNPDDAIPRRPIISHADEPNFRPPANNRDQPHKQIMRPGGLRFENGRFPPSQNYNFKPPHDQQPDIFTQMGTNKIINDGGTRIVNGNHLETRLPSSNIVKVIAGNSVTALPVTANVSPEPFQFDKKEILAADGQKRRPIFIRPPPRSQEGVGWQQQIILPFPPESDEISTKLQIPLKVGAAEIQKVSRPFIRPQPQPQPAPTTFQQLVPNFSAPPSQFPPNVNNFKKPIQQSQNNIPPQQFSEESPNKLFFNTAEKPGGPENPFNRQPQRPGLGIIEKQRRPPLVITDSSEEETIPNKFRPQPPNSLSHFSPPPTFNFIPPTHYPPEQNNYQFNRDQYHPRPPQNPQPNFMVNSGEFTGNKNFGALHPPQNNFGPNVPPEYNVAHGQQISTEVSEENYFRPPNYPPAFRPNLDRLERPFRQNQQEAPFRPMNNQINNGHRPAINNEVQQLSHNFPYTPQQSSEMLKPNQINNLQILLPGMQRLPWNPNSENSHQSVEQNSAEHSPENDRMPELHSDSFERIPSQMVSPQPPPLADFDPTPHFPPYKQRPSTIFIVQETYDPLPNNDEESGFSSSSFPPMRLTTELPVTEEANSKKYPQLIIKEIPTIPYAITTTARPLSSSIRLNPTLFRRSSTTSKPKTTESPISTNYVEPDHGSSFSGFVISPTMQDLLNIGHDHTSNSISQGDSSFGEKIRLSDVNKRPKFSGSLASTKKPSLDFDKYFTGDNSFGQTFSGSEDNESIIDPVNQQVIKSPFDSNKQTGYQNINLNHEDSTDEKELSSSVTPAAVAEVSEEDFLNAFTLPEVYQRPSTPEDRLWLPTTFKPALRPLVSYVPPISKPTSEIIYVSEISGLKPYDFHKPTTYRNTLRPTTFRPRRPELYHPNLRNSLLSRPQHSFSGHVPFPYDDEEGLEDIKIKNVEIHKNPHFLRKPLVQSHTIQKRPISQSHPVLAFIPTSLEEEDDHEEQSYEIEKEHPPVPATHIQPPPPLRSSGPSYETSEEEQSLSNKNQQPGQLNNLVSGLKVENNPSEESQQSPVNSGENNKDKTKHPEEDTNETIELVPPGYPITRLRPPLNYENDNRNRPFFRQPPPGPPQQTKRPSPFESITNIFRRPNVNGRPNQQNFEIPGKPAPPAQLQTELHIPTQHNNPSPARQPQPNNNPFVRQPQPPRQNISPPPPPPNSNLRRPFRPEINDNFDKAKPIPLNLNTGNPNQRPPHQILSGLIRRPPPQGLDNIRNQAHKNPTLMNQMPDINSRPVPVSGSIQNSNSLVKPPQIPPKDSSPDPEIYSYEDEDISDENDVKIVEENKLTTTIKSTLRSSSTSSPNKNPERVSTNTVKKEEYTSNKNNEETKKKETDVKQMSDQRPEAAGDSFDEEVDDGSDGETEEDIPTKVEPETSPNRPIHIGGHLINGFRPHPPRIPKPVSPQRGTFIIERPPIHDSSEFLAPTPPSPPKTEMEPPPIDSLRLKPSILELPSNGPIRYRPGRPGAQEVNLRPNLLRPDKDLLKPTLLRPRPTFHTIASVDDGNKIVGTNVVEVLLSSRSTTIGSTSSGITPTATLDASRITSPTKKIIGSVETVGLDIELSSSIEDDLFTSSTLSTSSSNERSASVVEYSGGIFKTVVVNTDKESILPSRTFTRTITRTSQSRSSTDSSTPETTTSRSTGSLPSVLSTRKMLPSTPAPRAKPTSATESHVKPKPAYNPFIPSRGPPSPHVPWRRRSTTTTVSPISESTTLAKFSTSTLISEDRVAHKYNRTRPFSVKTDVVSTTTTDTHPMFTEESKNAPVTPLSAPPIVRTHYNGTYRPTTFRPVVRTVRPDPNLENRDRIYGNSSISFVVSSNSNGQGTTMKGLIVATQKTTPSVLEGQDEEKDGSEIVVQIPLLTKNGTVSVVTNGNKNIQSRIPPFLVKKPVIIVSTVSSVSMKTTTMLTRLVTHTETSTQTITETETTVVFTAGHPMTHTIMITKTNPPQTLISTIVGTVTVVNTVDVTPTTVRTTIYSQPTKSVTSFTGSPELPEPSRTTEKILQGGVAPTASKPITKAIPSPPKSESANENLNEAKKIKHNLFDIGCKSNCSIQGNQLCRHFGNGTRTKCVCKPGYARMKSTTPCRPTFTYEMNLSVNHMEGMTFDFRDLRNDGTDAYLNFVTVTKDALDKAFLSTDLKRQFQGAEIMKIQPTVVRNNKTNAPEPKVNVDFLVQLTVNMTEDRIKNHLIRTLKASNFSVGRTGVTTTKNMSDFGARDFNECYFADFNDCSIHADCINLRGSYLCQCQYGYKDLSKKNKPGRDCLEMAGCAECNYKGNCYPNKQGNNSCDCFRWYGGAECQINLKILLMTIIGVGAILFILVLLCGVLVCKRNRRARERQGSGRFMRYRSPTSPATLERTAIMHDSGSSDGSQTPTVRANAQPYTPDSLLINQHDDKRKRRTRTGDANLMNFSLRNVVMDQDRSLTVVIPRAKIRPSSRPNPSTSGGGPDTGIDLADSESKLINYLDQGPYPAPANKMGGGKTTTASRQSTLQRNNEAKAFRKLSLQERRISSGALVSSGTEVSARGGMRRRSTGLEPELPFRGYEKTISDVRSYDETTVRSHAKPLFSSETSRNSCYSCKPPSYCAYSESAGHTMAEKDGASTVYTTQGKLFRMSQDTDSNLSSD